MRWNKIWSDMLWYDVMWWHAKQIIIGIDSAIRTHCSNNSIQIIIWIKKSILFRSKYQFPISRNCRSSFPFYSMEMTTIWVGSLRWFLLRNEVTLSLFHSLFLLLYTRLFHSFLLLEKSFIFMSITRPVVTSMQQWRWEEPWHHILCLNSATPDRNYLYTPQR